MGKKRRSWSTNEKLQILREGDLYGMTETMRRHNLSSSLYYKWKAQLLEMKIRNRLVKLYPEVSTIPLPALKSKLFEIIRRELGGSRLRLVLADHHLPYFQALYHH